jgi:hypothetical protein
VTDFDSPWKEALDRYFQPFLALLFPQAHAGIDWSRGYEPLDKELQEVARGETTGPVVVDKLFKVWRTSGEEEWILVHVEVQSQPDVEFTRRMYRYHYRIYDKYTRTVVSLAVLGDDRPSWRPDRFVYNLWGCGVDFRFPAVKLLDVAADEAALLQARNPVGFVVLAHRRAQEAANDPERRLSYAAALVRHLYSFGFSREDVRELFRLITWFMNLPRELDLQLWREVQTIEQEKHMAYVTTVERIAREEGVAEGRAEGRVEGRAEGRADGLRQAIELMLDSKFGEEGRALMGDVRRVAGEDALRSLLQLIQKTDDLDDVRAALPANE